MKESIAGVLRALTIAIAQLQRAMGAAVRGIPGWPAIERLSLHVTAPVRWLADAALRAMPFLRRLEWLLEVQRLKAAHPVMVAGILLFALYRGLKTTSLGHIGTDKLIYPLLCTISAFNPFLGLSAGVSFGIGDFVQKLAWNDMYLVHARDANYFGALAGYFVGYSAVMFAGVFPGMMSRVFRLAARETIRAVFFRRAAAAADGATDQPVVWKIYVRTRGDGTAEFSVASELPLGGGWREAEGPFTWRAAWNRIAQLKGAGIGVTPDVPESIAQQPPPIDVRAPEWKARLSVLADRGLLGDRDAWRTADGLTPEDKRLLAYLRGHRLLDPGNAGALEALVAKSAAPIPPGNGASLGDPLTARYPIPELLASMLGTAVGAYGVMYAAPVLVRGAFVWRPDPDWSCLNMEATTMTTHRAPEIAGISAPGGVVVSAVANPVAGGPAADAAAAAAATTTAGPSSTLADTETGNADRIQGLRDLWSANDHDRRQAEQNLREMDERLHELPAPERALLENSADFKARRQHEMDMISEAERSKRDLERQLELFGATPEGGIDPHGDLHRGGGKWRSDDMLNDARFDDAQQRYRQMSDAAANRGSVRAMDMVDAAEEKIFSGTPGTFNQEELDSLADRLRREHRAQQMLHEGRDEAVDAVNEWRVNALKATAETGKAMALLIVPPASLPGLLVNAAYGTLTAYTGAEISEDGKDTGGKNLGDSLVSGGGHAIKWAAVDVVFRLGANVAAGLFPETAKTLGRWMTADVGEAAKGAIKRAYRWADRPVTTIATEVSAGAKGAFRSAYQWANRPVSHFASEAGKAIANAPAKLGQAIVEGTLKTGGQLSSEFWTGHPPGPPEPEPTPPPKTEKELPRIRMQRPPDADDLHGLHPAEAPGRPAPRSTSPDVDDAVRKAETAPAQPSIAEMEAKARRAAGEKKEALRDMVRNPKDPETVANYRAKAREAADAEAQLTAARATEARIAKAPRVEPDDLAGPNKIPEGHLDTARGLAADARRDMQQADKALEAARENMANADDTLKDAMKFRDEAVARAKKDPTPDNARRLEYWENAVERNKPLQQQRAAELLRAEENADYARRAFKAAREDYLRADPRRDLRLSEQQAKSADTWVQRAAADLDEAKRVQEAAEQALRDRPADPDVARSFDRARAQVLKAERNVDRAGAARVKAGENMRRAAERLQTHMEAEQIARDRIDNTIKDRFGLGETPTTARPGQLRVSDSLQVKEDFIRGSPPPKEVPDGLRGFNQDVTSRSIPAESTAVHERLHANTSGRFSVEYAPPRAGEAGGIDEGLTQHLAQKVLDHEQALLQPTPGGPAWPPRSGSYAPQRKTMENLEQIVGEQRLADAYFKGKVNTLNRKVGEAMGIGDMAAAQAEGARTLKVIDRALKQGRSADADAILDLIRSGQGAQARDAVTGLETALKRPAP